MGKKRSSQPTEVELQILNILWELGSAPVREVHARLNAAKGTNYSTTVKMLAVMRDKGLVLRDEEVSPHIYEAKDSREKTGTSMVGDLINKVYDGAALSLVLQALSTAKPTKQELDEVREMLDELEKSS
jgi:BlaI family penicillinase repressor